MINTQVILECLQKPMRQYYHEMVASLGNWQPLEDAAEKLLQGEDVRDDEVPAAYLPIVAMMRLIARVTRESEWDWANPVVQEFFKNKAESELYKIFTNAIVGTVAAIIKQVKIGTLVEIGTGPGKITAKLCEEMAKNNVSIPIIISDRAPGVMQVRDSLQKSFPALSINAFIWDIRSKPPTELVERLSRPVLLFERFCLPYAGHEAIDMIAPLADILILQDDLSLTGKKMAFDVLYGRIGTRFLVYDEAMRYLKKYFRFIHTCDREVTEALKSTVTSFTVAVKS